MGGKPPKNKKGKPLLPGEDPPSRKYKGWHDETPLEGQLRRAMNGGARPPERKK